MLAHGGVALRANVRDGGLWRRCRARRPPPRRPLRAPLELLRPAACFLGFLAVPLTRVQLRLEDPKARIRLVDRDEELQGCDRLRGAPHARLCRGLHEERVGLLGVLCQPLFCDRQEPGRSVLLRRRRGRRFACWALALSTEGRQELVLEATRLGVRGIESECGLDALQRALVLLHRVKVPRRREPDPGVLRIRLEQLFLAPKGLLTIHS